MDEPIEPDMAGEDDLDGMIGDGREASRGHPTPVRVLLRGLEIIEALNRHGPLTTAALSQRLRLARTTVNRCLATLESEGYVERLPNRRHALTSKAVTLSHGFDAALERIEPVRAAMHAASVRVQWPMSLMRLQFPQMHIEDSTDRESGFAVEYFERGMQVPVLTTASGRAIVAFSSLRVRESLLEHLWPTRPDETLLAWSDRASFERDMALTRERGYARCTRPLRLTEQGSLAVPVMVDGEPVAALAVRFALSAVSFDEARKRLLPVLLEIALAKGPVVRSLPNREA
ncbi:MAG: helix-turn-helix domain-containing protein [Gammaproteobacteria bacterium]|nr:helix-turn-helix domain-containing protein [Gammaproteobacteria bacterium]